MTKIIISPKVIDLIDEYAKNLSEYTGDTKTGKHFAQKCLDTIDDLKLFPERCRFYDEATNQRELIIDNHLILYNYNKGIDIIFVTNIKSGYQKDYD